MSDFLFLPGTESLCVLWGIMRRLAVWKAKGRVRKAESRSELDPDGN